MTTYPIRHFGACINPECEMFPCSFFGEESALFRSASLNRVRSTKCTNCRCSEANHDLLYMEVAQGVFLDCRPHCRASLIKPVLFPDNLDDAFTALPPRDLEKDNSFRQASSSHTPGHTISVFKRLGLMASTSNSRLAVQSPTPSAASTLVLSQTEDEDDESPEKRIKRNI